MSDVSADDDMVQTAADAAYAAFEALPEYATSQMNGLIAREMVRAALSAIRPHEFGDLAESVALAGEEAIDRYGHGSYRAAHGVFAAMIDAVLDTDRLACASGTLTEGGDVEQAPGDSLSGPTAESRDAQ